MSREYEKIHFFHFLASLFDARTQFYNETVLRLFGQDYKSQTHGISLRRHLERLRLGIRGVWVTVRSAGLYSSWYQISRYPIAALWLKLFGIVEDWAAGIVSARIHWSVIPYWGVIHRLSSQRELSYFSQPSLTEVAVGISLSLCCLLGQNKVNVGWCMDSAANSHTRKGQSQIWAMDVEKGCIWTTLEFWLVVCSAEITRGLTERMHKHTSWYHGIWRADWLVLHTSFINLTVCKRYILKGGNSPHQHSTVISATLGTLHSWMASEIAAGSITSVSWPTSCETGLLALEWAQWYANPPGGRSNDDSHQHSPSISTSARTNQQSRCSFKYNMLVVLQCKQSNLLWTMVIKTVQLHTCAFVVLY